MTIVNGGMSRAVLAPGTVFTDVPASAFAAAWIEDLAARGITSGCGGSGSTGFGGSGGGSTSGDPTTTSGPTTGVGGGSSSPARYEPTRRRSSDELVDLRLDRIGGQVDRRQRDW